MLLCAAVCALISMNDMAAPSVSLEGKSLWLAQSLPVTAWQVLRAKLRMHLLLTAVPGAVLGVCLVAVCDFPPAQMAAVLALAAVFLVFSALLNLFLGLKMPNLHWTSEITPIKQSGAVAISLLGGWAYAAAMAVLYFLVGRHMGFAAYMAAFLALTLAAAVLLTCLVYPLLQRLPAGAGLAASAALFALTNQLPEGYLGFENWRLCAVPAGLYRANLFWLGLPDLTRFTSADYFPVVPWVFLFWCGVFHHKFVPFLFGQGRGARCFAPAVCHRAQYAAGLHAASARNLRCTVGVAHGAGVKGPKYEQYKNFHFSENCC